MHRRCRRGDHRDRGIRRPDHRNGDHPVHRHDHGHRHGLDRPGRPPSTASVSGTDLQAYPPGTGVSRRLGVSRHLGVRHRGAGHPDPDRNGRHPDVHHPDAADAVRHRCWKRTGCWPHADGPASAPDAA